jgi:hypothetical protein
MIVTFRKAGRTCAWTALRPPRTVVPGPSMAAGGDLPHDLFTFVIEQELGIEHGFWGCVAAGATFKSLGRKRTRPGREVIARHETDLAAAEHHVNQIYGAWRGGQPTGLDAQLDSMLQRWQALADGEELRLEWAARGQVRSGSSRPRSTSGHLG